MLAVERYLVREFPLCKLDVNNVFPNFTSSCLLFNLLLELKYLPETLSHSQSPMSHFSGFLKDYTLPSAFFLMINLVIYLVKSEQNHRIHFLINTNHKSLNCSVCVRACVQITWWLMGVWQKRTPGESSSRLWQQSISVTAATSSIET